MRPMSQQTTVGFEQRQNRGEALGILPSARELLELKPKSDVNPTSLRNRKSFKPVIAQNCGKIGSKQALRFRNKHATTVCKKLTKVRKSKGQFDSQLSESLMDLSTQQSFKMHNLCGLPDDLRAIVASFLTPKEFLIKVQILSKHWRSFALRQSLWTYLQSKWPLESLTPFTRLRFCKSLTCRRSRGSIIVAEDRITGKTCSIRAIDMAVCNGGVEDGFPTSVLRQIASNHNLSHPNVTKYDQVFQCQSSIVLQRDHYQWDLREFIRSHRMAISVTGERPDMYAKLNCLPQSTIKSIIGQIISGIAYCHS